MSPDSNDPWDRLFEPKTSGTSGVPGHFRYTTNLSESPAEPRNTDTPSSGIVFLAMMFAILLVSLVQGILVWLILEFVEDFGWIDKRISLWPCLLVVLALNGIRFFDRMAFRRP